MKTINTANTVTEERIITIMDNLSIEQTHNTLEKTAETDFKDTFGRGSYKRIENSVFEKIGSNSGKQKRGFTPKKVIVFAAICTALALTITVAAFSGLFTFIPGFGIVESDNSAIYAMESITGRVNAESNQAEIISAVYMDGHLNVTVTVKGKALYHNDFEFLINGNKADIFADNPMSLAVSSDSTMLNFSYEVDEPTVNDLFEIAISGFSEHLSFKMIPCLDYDDISKIGPTEIQNNISITATADRIDNELIVWCYPFRLADSVKDRIIGIGVPMNVGWNTEHTHIATSSGKIFDESSGWVINERFVFEMPEQEQAATLHIPFLTMFREENKQLRLNLPKSYGTQESVVALNTSLGMVRITEIKREQSEYDSDKDTVWIRLEYDSKDDNMRLYKFNLDVKSGFGYAIHSHETNGTVEYIEVIVGKNDNRISLDINGLYYYLMGEYQIELDINK
jgi:hypothetical protein